MIRFLTFGFIVLMLVVSGMTYAQENNSFNMAPLNEGLASSSFLEEEAGISAYSQVSNVDLDAAEDAFKNVEKKTEDYIIGSVALPDYGESDDVHVYVDINGWMVAYYLKQEKASKIIDWKNYHETGQMQGSKIETAMRRVCDEMNTILPGVQYCDFRYPSAKHIKIIVDEAPHKVTESFRIQIPTSCIVYNRTWSHSLVYISGYVNGSGILKIDGVILNNNSTRGAYYKEWNGEISASQLAPDEFHTLIIQNTSDVYGHNYINYAAIVLLYSEE